MCLTGLSVCHVVLGSFGVCLTGLYVCHVVLGSFGGVSHWFICVPCGLGVIWEVCLTGLSVWHVVLGSFGRCVSRVYLYAMWSWGHLGGWTKRVYLCVIWSWGHLEGATQGLICVPCGLGVICEV